jgi:hypothetical protein
MQDSTGEPSGDIRSEEHCNVGYVFGPSETSERSLRDKLLLGSVGSVLRMHIEAAWMSTFPCMSFSSVGQSSGAAASCFEFHRAMLAAFSELIKKCPRAEAPCMLCL